MKSFLPDQYHFAHEYSKSLIGYLVSLIVFGEQNQIYTVPIKFKNDDDEKEFSKLNGIEISDWLEKHGYKDELEKMILKSLFPALLSDFCQFITEALDCSDRARLTVTYALLRKPFRDNLFYLECLLAEPRGFINTFYEKNPSEFSLDKMLREDKVREIVRQVVDRTAKKDSVDPNIIYDIRYNKLTEYSFDKMWNKALHLVTTAKTHSTEFQNLNFIFSDDEDRFHQWMHIYSFLPIVLDYTVDVAETLMFIILGDERPGYYVDFFHRELGFAVWSKEMIDWQENSDLSTEMPNDLEDLHIACPKCNKVIDMQENLARSLFLERKMKCPNCFRRITIESIVEKNELRPNADTANNSE
jgi:phage FluMu protein Com